MKRFLLILGMVTLNIVWLPVIIGASILDGFVNYVQMWKRHIIMIKEGGNGVR